MNDTIDSTVERNAVAAVIEGPNGNDLDAIGGQDILTLPDLSDLSAGRLGVFKLMKDGGWHTVPEMHTAAGVVPGEAALQGDRRWREVRTVLGLQGWGWEKRKVPGSKRVWEYRLIAPSLV